MKKKFVVPIIVIISLAVVLTLVYVIFMRPVVIPGMGSGDIQNNDGITLATEFPIYDRSCEYVTLIINNNSGEDAEFGSGWSLEKKVLGGWANVPFQPNTTFTSILCILNDGGEKVMTCYLTNFMGEIADGKYRIVKEINDTPYTAEFEIGESEITAESPFGYELVGTFNKYSYDVAVADGCVDLSTGENEEKILHFLRAVQTEDREAQIRFVETNEKGELILTDIFRSRNGAYRLTKWNKDKLNEMRFSVSVASSVTTILDYSASLSDVFSVNYYSYLVTDGELIYLSNTSDYTAREDDFLIIPQESMNDELKSFIKNEYRTEEEYLTLKIWANDGLRSASKRERPEGDDLEFWVNEYSENGVGIKGQTLSLNKDNMNDPSGAKIVEFVWDAVNALTIVAEDGKLDGNTSFYYKFRDVDTFEPISYTHSVHDYIIEDGMILIPE